MTAGPTDRDDLDPARLLMVVAGAHLRAECDDRPLAYLLRQAIADRLEAGPAAGRLRAIVCSDLWYLNASELMRRPTIAVGRPQHNAVSAWLANRLPSVLVIDQRLQVQLDPDFLTLQACIWGTDGPSTAAGVELFEKRYLDAFLRAACGE
jgi:hypothetical protein